MTEVVRPRGRKPFALVENENNFLWFCLTVRSSGIAASTRLGITDWWEALDIDNAVAYRLLKFDNEARETAAKLIALEVSKIFGDGSSDSGDAMIEPGVEIW